MAFTILKIYKEYGQYDDVCNITFIKDSPSYKKYGGDLTGDFFYTKDERLALQQRLDDDDQTDEEGNVKIIERLRKVSDEDRKALIKEGFPCQDIQAIFSFPNKKINDYVTEEIRSLPEPIVVKFDASKFNPITGYIWLNEQRRNSGYNLTAFECDQDIAYRILANGNKIPETISTAEYADPQTGLLKESIRYAILHHVFFYGELSPEEDAEFKQILESRVKKSFAILEEEIKRSTEKFKKAGINYADALNALSYLVAFFEEERLSHTKIPVWWNLERFLHIYMRHVSEVQMGERFEAKTTFQYKLKDIRGLIDIILKQLAPEIEQHFEKNPGKDFKRQGSMSVYHNGDYYAIHIRADGLLMTFYKNS